MGMNQMLPVWMTVSGASTEAGVTMATNIASDAVKCQWEDNIGIQCKWTGTPTGTLAVQISLDPTALGWETRTFSPAPAQPAGSASGTYFEVNQSTAAWVRLIYTAGSSTGTLYAKITLKSV